MYGLLIEDLEDAHANGWRLNKLAIQPTIVGTSKGMSIGAFSVNVELTNYDKETGLNKVETKIKTNETKELREVIKTIFGKESYKRAIQSQ